ncbi:sensor histidine kinase [Paenibacillus macerans]|uniref:sensor histidine kinase n=1 Tax=Paenibacillus macerans TaxID=44252 RepID=UPI00203ABF0C|nr:sensor histidine kinase [Paenibacillus macerans]MCM3699481.1 sensor histidine kinase [Paenibacillus macerans]
MQKALEKLSRVRLFTKLFLVMTMSIAAVCLLTSLITIRMSERLFAETFSITNGKVLKQINTSLDSFNDSIVNAATYAAQSGTVKTYLTGGELDSVSMSKVFYRMSEQMDQLASNLGAFDVAVTITGINGRSYSTDRAYWPVTGEELAADPLTARTAANPGRILYQYDTRQGADGAEEHFIIASKALVDRTGGLHYGTLYIAIREREFKQFFESFTSAGNDVLVLDKSGVIVSANRPELIGTTNADLLDDAVTIARSQLDYHSGTVLGKERIILSHDLPSYNFYLVNLIDRQYTARQIINVKSVVLTCMIIIVFAMLVVFVMSRRLTGSLTRLVRQMSTIAKKDFSNYITVSGGFEVRELGKAFNYMLDELNDYIRRLLETQKEQRNAELAALQRQINPHFLYNTLASIKMLVQKGSKSAAAETINALISLLQNTISNVSETITIRQELENMRNYVFINHVRYGDRIKVNYFVSPDCLHYAVPKLIIQPFIENAFFHAFNAKNEGTIYILVSKNDGSLVCEVVDNGDGMELTEGTGALPNAKSNRQLFTGIGIQNVDNRIKLLYGESYGVHISSAKGEGTKIRIVLPLVAGAASNRSC